MKLKIILSLLVFSIALCSYAQEKGNDSSGRRYISLEYLVAGEGNSNLNKTDFALNDFMVKVGYQFKHKISLYIPITQSLAKENLCTTRNYSDQTLIGLGTEYEINTKQNSFLLDLSVSSTIRQAQQKYMTATFMVKVASLKNASTTIGIGLIYNKPYTNTLEDRFLLGFSWGCRIF